MTYFFNLIRNNKINILFLFFSYLLIFSSFWIKKTFGNHVYYAEVIYNLFVNIKGVKDAPNTYKINFILYVINLSIFFTIISLLIFENLKKKIKINFLKSQIFNYKIYLLISALFFLYQFKFHEYIKSYIVYEDYSYLYNDPSKIKFDNPKNKKNLIIIYVESLEYKIQNLNEIIDYSKITENYEKYETNPILEIDNLDGKNIYNFKEAPPNAFSIGGLVSSQCSVPFYPSVSTNLKKLKNEKMFCLSDVLNLFGYQQYYFMTVNKDFHRTDLFKENHHYSIFDNKKIRENYPNADFGWGHGVYDNILLDAAKKKIKESFNTNQPFNIVIKTTDTHPPYYLASECNQKRSGTLEINAHLAFQCSSKLISDFFEDLKLNGVLDNTTVVILGDHLAYDALIKLYRTHPSRNIYFKMNTEKNYSRLKMNHYDLAPTILDEMGFMPKKINKFGLGVSLFNNNKNFNYDDHYDLIMDKNILNDFFIRQSLKQIPKREN